MFESWKCGFVFASWTRRSASLHSRCHFWPGLPWFQLLLLSGLVPPHTLHSQLLCLQFQCGAPTSVQYGFSIAILVRVTCCSISAVILLLLVVTSHKWLNCFSSSSCISCILTSHPVTWSPMLRTCHSSIILVFMSWVIGSAKWGL